MTPLRTDRTNDETQVLRSPTLEAAGFPHAFSTRYGPGGSTYDLSRPGHSLIGTPAHDCDRLLQHFASIVDPNHPRSLRTPRQVHGCDLVDARDAYEAEADAVLCDEEDLIAAIRTADCVGILMACPRSGIVAAVHAGWRGILADMPGTAARELARRTGSSPETLLAAIGPAIGVEAYEVGQEVAEAFTRAGLGEHLSHAYGPRAHLDLHAAARQRLLGAGIRADSIDGEPLCTLAEPRFFSHRGDGGNSGRLLAAIAPTSGINA